MPEIEQATPVSETEQKVTVYNRSPAVYKHRDKATGAILTLPPGASADVPAYVGDIWRRISSGAVSSASGGSSVSNVNAALAEAQVKLAAKDRQLAEMQARLEALEKRPK